MKILAINNYSLSNCLKVAKDSIMPYQHCWGIDYFMRQGDDVDTELYINVGGLKGFVLSFWYCLKNISTFNKHDVVIAFCNPVIGWASLFKRVGLLKCKLYTLVHHEGNHMLLFSGYDRILFLSKEIMIKTRQKYPSLANRMEYIEWGPDLDFYKDAFHEYTIKSQTALKPISTGKTNRDNVLMDIACKSMDIPLLLITDLFKGSSNTKVISSSKRAKNAVSYPEMLSLMSKCNLTLVCKNKDESVLSSLCGLTSFIDALAIGQPIIISDNTNISIDIEKLKIGFTYKAGDLDDFKAKLNIFKQNPSLIKEYGDNARKYAEKHSYEDYCKQLYRIINE